MRQLHLLIVKLKSNTIRNIKIIQNKTSIIIAHRLSTILNSDKIIVLENGNIVESGSHEQLIRIEDGFYKKLYELQFQKDELIGEVV